MGIYKFFLVVILILSPIYSQSQWEQLNSGTNTFFRDLCFISDNVGWVVGYNGVILKTTD